jgi:predicted RNA-binding protein with EMAP domain
MYMYQEPEFLARSPSVSQLMEAAAILAEAYRELIASQTDRSLLRANIRWCVRILGGLAVRIGHPARSLAAGIDLLAVRIENVSPQGSFFLTRVSDGQESYSVVTNLKGVSSNTRLAAAFLPPREIGGAVSEAMFLGSDEREEPPGTRLAEEGMDLKDAIAVLYEEVGRTSR